MQAKDKKRGETCEIMPYLSLKILDVVNFLGEIKLDTLGIFVSTEIVVNFNKISGDEHGISVSYTGTQIKQQLDSLPIEIRRRLNNAIIIHGDLAREFFTKLFNDYQERQEEMLKDTEIKGSLVNTFSVIVILICIGVLYIYVSTQTFRGPVKETVTENVVESIIVYVTGYDVDSNNHSELPASKPGPR